MLRPAEVEMSKSPPAAASPRIEKRAAQRDARRQAGLDPSATTAALPVEPDFRWPTRRVQNMNLCYSSWFLFLFCPAAFHLHPARELFYRSVNLLHSPGACI